MEKMTRVNNIVYGPNVNIEIDHRGLGTFIFESFEKHENKYFQVDAETSEKETYASVKLRSIRVAIEMQKRGIKKNDVAVICSGNHMDAVLPFLGSLYISAITAYLDPSLSLRDTAYLVGIVRPKMIFVEMSALQLIEDAIKTLSFKIQVVVFGKHPNYISFNEFLKSDKNESSFRPVIVKNDKETACLFFSSGTTGMPKAIGLSHYGLLYSQMCLQEMEIYPSVMLNFSTFYWISAFCLTLVMVRQGGLRVLCRSFKPHVALKAIQDCKVTCCFLATTSMYSFNKEITSLYDTSSLKTLLVGGSSIPPEQFKIVQSCFPDTYVTMAYGMTEASGVISLFTRKYHGNLVNRNTTTVVSSGQPMIGIQIKVVDPDTEVLLGPNQTGEIRLFTTALMNGYYNENLTDEFDSTGFLKTGDLGYYDDENCLYVCDRIKEMFKYKCWHIVPASVEIVIHKHPAVQEAVVIGIPNTEDGDHPMALVILKEEYRNTTPEEIKTFVDEHVLERETLRAGLKIVQEFPKTATGKILRRQVRDMVLKGL